MAAMASAPGKYISSVTLWTYLSLQCLVCISLTNTSESKKSHYIAVRPVFPHYWEGNGNFQALHVESEIRSFPISIF